MRVEFGSFSGKFLSGRLAFINKQPINYCLVRPLPKARHCAIVCYSKCFMSVTSRRKRREELWLVIVAQLVRDNEVCAVLGGCCECRLDVKVCKKL